MREYKERDISSWRRRSGDGEIGTRKSREIGQYLGQKSIYIYIYDTLRERARFQVGIISL